MIRFHDLKCNYVMTGVFLAVRVWIRVLWGFFVGADFDFQEWDDKDFKVFERKIYLFFLCIWCADRVVDAIFIAADY